MLIAPLGTHVVVYEFPAQRTTWAAHGVDGCYLDPALDHRLNEKHLCIRHSGMVPHCCLHAWLQPS